MTNVPDVDFSSAINEIARLTRKQFDQRTRGMGPTRAQWLVIVTLTRYPGISQSALADILELEPITIGRIIDRMEEAGWIERRSDPKDRRAYQLFVTDRATPLMDELRIIAGIVRDEALSDLDQAEQEILINLLARVRATVLERVGRGRPPHQPQEARNSERRVLEKTH